METIKALEQEKNELNALINSGISFEVMDVEFQTKRIFGGLWKRRVAVQVKRQFKIEEPTLATLDRLSSEYIDFVIDEEVMKSSDGLMRAKRLVYDHSLRCARVLAIAVMGEEYLIPKYGGNGIVRYEKDTRQLNRLTKLFARTIKPSQLYQLYSLVNVMSNMGDFLNSIRLMSADRTTMPIRVEENNED